MKNNLKMYRALKSLTQEEFAKELNISRQAVVAMEADKYDCSIRLANRIAVYFGCLMEDIFFEDEEEPRLPKFRDRNAIILS